MTNWWTEEREIQADELAMHLSDSILDAAETRELRAWFTNARLTIVVSNPEVTVKPRYYDTTELREVRCESETLVGAVESARQRGLFDE